MHIKLDRGYMQRDTWWCILACWRVVRVSYLLTLPFYSFFTFASFHTSCTILPCDTSWGPLYDQSKWTIFTLTRIDWTGRLHLVWFIFLNLKPLNLWATDQGVRSTGLTWNFIFGWSHLDLSTPTSPMICGAPGGPSRCLALAHECLRALPFILFCCS